MTLSVCVISYPDAFQMFGFKMLEYEKDLA